jgi:hypothetical protein
VGGRQQSHKAPPDAAAPLSRHDFLETMMVWQLLQVRKLYDTPLVVAGEMWAELVKWARVSMLRPDGALASPEDLAIPICCRTGAEILDIIRAHHGRWKTNQVADTP